MIVVSGLSSLRHLPRMDIVQQPHNDIVDICAGLSKPDGINYKLDDCTTNVQDGITLYRDEFVDTLVTASVARYRVLLALLPGTLTR